MIEIRHTQETRSIYDQIYQSEAINQMDSFFLWILRLLRVNAGSRLLDISTGRGQMVHLARQYSIDACGIDFSTSACQIAADKTPGQIICANGQQLPIASNSFDFVTNLGSLEHFEQMDQGVREMARVLKPTGLACLTLPNTFGLLWSVNIAWQTGDVDDDGQPLQRYGTRKQWQHLLEENGLRVIQIRGYEHEHAVPRTIGDLKSYWLRPKRTLIMLGARWIPVNAVGQFVFICAKQSPSE
ncbi:MAG: class I SAM-dependent methyltransferase [Caldilineaceae bacterium]|nr:class I SAM-dependent methyltransferase [Caldilineaceae bacterium]